MGKFIGVFRNKTFSKLFFASFASQMGSVIGMTAFTFYLLARFSKQPAYASVAEMMYSLPTLAVFFLVGVIADRMDRQKTAYYCDWISAVLSFGLMGACFIGWMPLIFAVLFIRSAVQKFFSPAESGIVQGVLEKEDYASAAGLNQIVSSLFMLFGSGLGILAYHLTGVYGAIVIDGISFIISAILMKLCRINTAARLPNGPHTWKDIRLSLVFKDFKMGASYIINHALLRSLLAGAVLFGVVNGGFSVIPIFILKYKLAPAQYESLSVIEGIVFGAGVLAGSFLASLLAQKFKFHQLIIMGLMISGVFMIVASFSGNVPVLMFMFFLVGLSLPLINIAFGGWMPSIVDPAYMGRVQGWVGPLTMLAQSATLAFIGWAFPARLSIESLFWIVGGCLVGVAIYYMAVLPKYVNEDPKHVKEPSIVS